MPFFILNSVQVAGMVLTGQTDMAPLFLPLTAAAILLYRLMETGRIGRVLTAPGDSEVALVSVGYNAQAAKTLAFAIQGAYAGLAGALYAAMIGFIDPYSFNPNGASQGAAGRRRTPSAPAGRLGFRRAGVSRAMGASSSRISRAPA